MAMWVTEIGDLPPADAQGISAGARQRGEFTRGAVEAAASRVTTDWWRSAVSCIGRIGRRPCGARVQVRRVVPQRVEWWCVVCGDEGTIVGFAGTNLDLSAYVPRGKTVAWGFDEEERRLLRQAANQFPQLRAVIARARLHAEIAELLLVEATVPELDEMYTLVEELAGVTRSPKRIEILDGLRASLCTSNDGF
jgi:hypothetical protein